MFYCYYGSCNGYSNFTANKYMIFSAENLSA